MISSTYFSDYSKKSAPKQLLVNQLKYSTLILKVWMIRILLKLNVVLFSDFRHKVPTSILNTGKFKDILFEYMFQISIRY